MRVDLFDFALPDEAIALRPVVPRDAARLLLVGPGGRLDDRHVADLPDALRAGDILVVNDTRVIRARLEGRRIRPDGGSARVEIMLHTRGGAAEWRALARPAKRLRVGDTLLFGASGESPACEAERLEAVVTDRGEGGDVGLRFTLAGPFLDEAVARFGTLPLPPYIEGRRPADARDEADYQTVYAAQDGAVAAPTAGLHLTPALLERLRARGVEHRTLTLHVGAGTFLPVKAEETGEHRMHAEWGAVSDGLAATLNRARAAGGRVVAIGTTSLRLLESAAGPDGTILPFEGWTDIFITPGYRFRAVDLLMTNFHLPRSTLFMLVSAFAGLDTMKAAYAHAIASGYRFYSYGDASLLHLAEGVA